MNLERIASAAQWLCGAETSGRPVAGLGPEHMPADEREAYAIGAACAAARGAHAGWKIAYINPAVQKALGISAPIFGRLVRERIHASPARLERKRFLHLIAETEFGVRMARDLAPAEAPFSLETVIAAVDAVFPSIEMADSRFANWRKVPPLGAIADNALANGWVHGAPIRDFRSHDLGAASATTRVNGRVVGSGSGANVMGSPLRALHWLANALAAQGLTLAAGQVVTTGALHDVQPLADGDVVEADFGALGSVRLEIAP